jgi:hypothetical protein
MFVSQEDRTALIWAAMSGRTEVFKVLIEGLADVDAKEKVRRRYNIGKGANNQRMLGSGLRNLGATGRKCPMHCSCGLGHGDLLTIVPSCARNMPLTVGRMAHSWCCRT